MKFIILSLIFFNQIFTLYSSTDDVVELTSSNFNKLVIQSNDLWMVEFYAPWCGHCKNLAPEYKKAAKALKGIVKVGAVDLTVHKDVGNPYGIQGFPTLKFFGENKRKPTDYNGQRNAKSIADFSMGQAKSVVSSRLSGGKKQSKPSGSQKKKSSGNSQLKNVVELTDSEFQQQVVNSDQHWFVMFYAPWCGHCKAMMPDFLSASEEVPEAINMGRVDCTANQSTCQNYQVQGYPTLKYFSAGTPEDYNGGRTKSDIISFAESKADVATPPKLVTELDSQQTFDDYCKNDKGVCIIAFLPHIQESGEEKRKQYIKELEDIREEQKGKPLTFMWSQGGNQFDLEEAFHLGFGYPALIAIHWGKQKLSTMRQTYNKKNVQAFIGDLLVGKAHVNNLRKNLPKIKKRKPKKQMKTEELQLNSIKQLNNKIHQLIKKL